MTDPDETEGRRSYRAQANSLASAQAAMASRRVKLMTSCPKCGLEAKTLLHRFCTHKECPVRDAVSKSV